MKVSRRTILSYLLGLGSGIGGLFLSLPFVRSFGVPEFKEKDYVDVELPKLTEGQLTVVPFMNVPIFFLKRTPEQIQKLTEENTLLSDSSSEESTQPVFAKNNYRSLKPDLFVGFGMCTHLGCAVSHNPPGVNADWGEFYKNGGFACPCHGARYDLAGRVFDGGPAPYNLVVPFYEYIDETTIRIPRQDI